MVHQLKNSIGLFGTCGSSTWRDTFIKAYDEAGIPYFNPQLPEGAWHPGCVKDENDNLMHNSIVLFPVTSETTGHGSLAEIGFSIQAALRRNPERYFILMIDDTCTDTKASQDSIADSNRARKLVKSKLREIVVRNDGVFLVENLSDMLALSTALYANIMQFNSIKSNYNY